MSNPFDETYWNFTQLIAWVHIGTYEAVQSSETDNGRVPSAAPIVLEGRLLREAHCLPYQSSTEANVAILRELREGRLTAYGHKKDRITLEEIPSLQWANMDFFYTPDFARPALRNKDSHQPSRDVTEWYDLTFKRENVLSIWPHPFANHLSAVTQSSERLASAIQKRRLGKAKRHADIQKFMDEIMRLARECGLQWDFGCLLFSKEEFYGEFVEEYPCYAHISFLTISDDLHELGIRFNRGRKPKYIRRLENLLRRKNKRNSVKRK